MKRRSAEADRVDGTQLLGWSITVVRSCRLRFPGSRFKQSTAVQQDLPARHVDGLDESLLVSFHAQVAQSLVRPGAFTFHHLCRSISQYDKGYKLRPIRLGTTFHHTRSSNDDEQ